jgi:hypothetical protein
MIGNKQLTIVNGQLRQHTLRERTVSSGVSKKARVTSNISALGFGMNAPVSSLGYMGATQYGRSLDGIVPDQSEETLIPFYRDIYYHDAIGGSACDLTATFPFSDWTLSGVDNERAQVYGEALSRLNMRTLMPEIGLHYLVDGDFIGSLIYEKEIKNFKDVFIHDRLFCQIKPSPFYSMDPVILAQPSARLRQFMSVPSPALKQLLSNYPAHLVDAFRGAPTTLDPLTTLHVARRGLSDRMSGSVSYLKRIFPIYLLEKTLYRGTLIELSKRQRSTTHVQVGGDNWEPTEAEMEDILAKFQSTEMDPLGAWITTRQDVQVNEIRQAGDFTKWTDFSEQFVQMKLRALCVSEAFLAGDANFSTAENALTVFLENIDAFRNFLTFKVLNYKLFPLIAVANGFYKKDSKPPRDASKQDMLMDVKYHKNFDIPTVIWQKQLIGRDGPSKLEMLNALADKGFPIAMRTWASAAGLDIGSLLNDLDEEEELRKTLAEYDKKIKATGFDPAANGMDTGMEGGEDLGNMADDNFDLSSVSPSRRHEVRQAIRQFKDSQRSLKRVGISKRSMVRSNIDTGAHTLTKTGKPKHVHNEHTFMRKQNEVLAKASERLADPNYREQVKRRVVRASGGRMPNVLNLEGL